MKVYISGYGVISSLGNTADLLMENLTNKISAVRKMDAWSNFNGLNCHIGAPAEPFDKMIIPRLARRTMSPMSEMATLATKQAFELAEFNKDSINFDRSMILMGSTTGSPIALEEYFQKFLAHNGPSGQSGTNFFKVMNHSVASNVASAMEFNGSVMSVSSACSTSAQAIILGWELIQSGLYDVIICGGADELHYLSAAVFDSVYAASRGYNDSPTSSPRPFDSKRDGLVVSEGASAIILESEQHLQKRKGKALAELCSGAYLCESSHMSQNNEKQMYNVMSSALTRAGLKASEIQYVSAHATGTLQGDAQEAIAIAKLFGDKVPTSSLKGHMGHSMAACGGLELIATLKMMERDTMIGTRNLEEVAPDCLGVYHLKDNLNRKFNLAISNNFAFGGINTSLIIKGL